MPLMGRLKKRRLGLVALLRTQNHFTGCKHRKLYCLLGQRKYKVTKLHLPLRLSTFPSSLFPVPKYLPCRDDFSPFPKGFFILSFSTGTSYPLFAGPAPCYHPAATAPAMASSVSQGSLSLLVGPAVQPLSDCQG